MKSTRKAYGEKLAELGEKNENIVVVDADLSKTTMTNIFREKFPKRHINVGIAEQDLIGVSCGLAIAGKTVFASTMAMFMAGRAYDQIRNSVGYSNIPVKLCSTHAGLSLGADGATHQMLEDISLMRGIPNMVVLSPSDETATKNIIENIVEEARPTYVRLGRCDVPDIYKPGETFEIGKAKVHGKGKDVCIFATGYTMHIAMEAMEKLSKRGIDARVVDIYSIKPIAEDVVIDSARQCTLLISIEDHSVIGGIGSAISEVLVKNEPKKLIMLGVQDKFGRSGDVAELMQMYGITKEKIIEEVENNLK